jgi:hypothetical protein
LVAVEDEAEFRRVAAAIEETEEYDDVEIVGDEAAGKRLGGGAKENGGRPVM